MGEVSRRESLLMARSISSWTLISAVNFGSSCFLKNSLTFAVDASSCYTCVNYLGPVQILVPSCYCKALPFSNAGKYSIRTRQRNLVAVTQRKIITRTCIFQAMITSLTDSCKKNYVQSSVKTFSLKEDEKQNKKQKKYKTSKGWHILFLVSLFVRDYSISFKLSNVDNFFCSWILRRDCVELFRKRKKL